MTKEVWRGQHVQFVWFIADVDGLSADEVFRRVWQIEPDQTQKNRTPNPANPFLSLASSAVDGLTSQVQIQPGRVDVIVTVEPGQENESVFDALFDLKKNILTVLNGINSRSAVARDAYRISTVATVLKPVASYQDGVKEFTQSLGFDFKIPNPSDLMFQVNSRKTIAGVPINRLLQISTMGFQTVAFPLVQGAVFSTPSAVPTQYAARRHLDFNTAPDGRVLEHARQASIFECLTDELLRIAESGSVADLRD